MGLGPTSDVSASVRPRGGVFCEEVLGLELTLGDCFP